MKKFIKLLSLSLAMLFIFACTVSCTSTDKYIIATDTVFAPFEFTDADGNLVGIDVEILAAIAED